MILLLICTFTTTTISLYLFLYPQSGKKSKLASAGFALLSLLLFIIWFFIVSRAY